MSSMQKGESVSYKAAVNVKYAQIAASLAALVLAVLHMFKSKYPVLQFINEDMVNSIVFGLFGAFNAWATVASTDKVGL